jgi:tetratricopeptide (TPR) repeat protein
MSDKANIIKEAQKYLARGQIDKAIGEWEKLVKESPDGNVFNTIGDLYLKSGNKKTAIDYYHKAASFFKKEGFSLKALALYKKILNINPTDSTSLISLGELNENKGLMTDAIKFYLAAADSLTKEGKKEDVLSIYKRILNISPTNIPLRNKIAEIFLKEGFLSEAADEYLSIANQYFENDEYDKAESYYKKVLEIKPVFREVYISLSEIYKKSNDILQAITYLEEAVNLFPADIDILLRLSNLLISNEKYEKAKDYLKAVLEIEPYNVKARRLLADVYIKEGYKDKAWEQYLPVLDEMLINEKYEDAINLLKSFKDIDPVETSKRLISLYMQLGEYNSIVEELNSLGDIYMREGQEREALNYYKEALKMSPDDHDLKMKVIELEKKISTEELSTAGVEKTLDEAIIEADILMKYGLYENAKDLLDKFKQIYPDNIEIHQRLKKLYKEIDHKEEAITECLALKDLYDKRGEQENSAQIVKEALEINPDDERLSSFKEMPMYQYTVETAKAPSIEEYSEEIAEADFYIRQGLIDEAHEILERLNNIFPDNVEIKRRLESLGHVVETGEPKVEKHEEVLEEKVAIEEMAKSEDVIEAEEVEELELDKDVLDIFEEFKKGLEKEVKEEDYETHYNLGIAYKEMALIDDAIKEFQISKKDPKRAISASNMLGLCYMEKGLYSLAIEAFKDAISMTKEKDESYWSMKYDLAEAYERNGDIKEALDLFIEVYGWNSKFRDVSEKINNLKVKVSEDIDKRKTKDRKDRVSYI